MNVTDSGIVAEDRDAIRQEIADTMTKVENTTRITFEQFAHPASVASTNLKSSATEQQIHP